MLKVNELQASGLETLRPDYILPEQCRKYLIMAKILNVLPEE